ncbi:hypothetical protein [Methanolobus bombayensis]|uniref:hypothetical protein n=1 Tax=Methanolobus bombayensis TaxID=38023 RepID=UPI001AE3E0E1|nr:hypothetical protein [Methanolobus bombayensis]MBP1907875.1 hypothetical protein [Methanolobus bombayensis]
MRNKNDFSWENGKIKNGDTLGKIVAIPTQDDSEPETLDETSRKQMHEEQSDIVIDEFKEKMTEILSRELHRKH